MKLKQLLFVGALSLIPLGLTAPAKAQGYCPATYGQVREAIANAARHDDLSSYSYMTVLYPTRSEVLLHQIRYQVYNNPSCETIQEAVGYSLNNFEALINLKKKAYSETQDRIRKLNSIRTVPLYRP